MNIELKIIGLSDKEYIDKIINDINATSKI